MVNTPALQIKPFKEIPSLPELMIDAKEVVKSLLPFTFDGVEITDENCLDGVHKSFFLNLKFEIQEEHHTDSVFCIEVSLNEDFELFDVDIFLCDDSRAKIGSRIAHFYGVDPEISINVIMENILARMEVLNRLSPKV